MKNNCKIKADCPLALTGGDAAALVRPCGEIPWQKRATTGVFKMMQAFSRRTAQ